MQSSLGFLVIDWTVSISSLLQGLAMLILGMGAFYSLRGDVRVLSKEVENVKLQQAAISEAMKQLTSVLTTLAQQQVRLDLQQKTIDELRHGHGWVNPLSS